MPKVLNKHKDTIPQNSIYIGRPSPWGNPFVIGKDGDRATVVQKYKDWVITHPELLQAIKEQLKGKDLVCYCAPLPCHGDVLIEIANQN